MNKPIVFALTALLLASGAAVAGDRGEHWGERHHHDYYGPYQQPRPYYHYYQERHHHHRHRHHPYYDPRPSYYYTPRYSGPGFNVRVQPPYYDFSFGFRGN